MTVQPHLPPPKGLGCCSPTAVTFHKVTVSDLYLFDYLLYTMVVAGRHSSAPFPPPPPPDRSRLTPEVCGSGSRPRLGCWSPLPVLPAFFYARLWVCLFFLIFWLCLLLCLLFCPSV